MQDRVRRGTIFFLREEAHRRLIPDDKEKNFGHRRFLVVQADFLNNKSSKTIVVEMKSAKYENQNDTEKGGVNVWVPNMGLTDREQIIYLANIYTISKDDLGDIVGTLLATTAGKRIMRKVDVALRNVLYLDVDGKYSRRP